MLRGIIPILLVPFNSDGSIDEESLRRVVRFELANPVHGIGIGGFASEAYKLTDGERIMCAEIVASEVNGRVPLIIGMSPGSTEAAIEQAHFYATLKPAALMVLPPNTMKHDESVLIQHYVDLAEASPIPIMIQQSPQIMAYAGCNLSSEALIQIVERAPNVHYLKIEGPGSAERIAALHQHVGNRVHLFGGIGGLGMREEFQAGASGLLPGCGFNEIFIEVWQAWEAGNAADVDHILQEAQPLVQAVSGRGHEFSLHARKHLLKRAGVIPNAYVRRPTVSVTADDMTTLEQLADVRNLRISASAIEQ
jgi:dihydrodipicolinate synthase/N-acetylneuraminate lyase